MLIEAGRSHPLGATVEAGGVNFSVYSRDAEILELLLFDRIDDAPVRVIRLDRQRNRTFHYWHVFVPGLTAGQIYAYRARGPHAPDFGLRFDGDKTLLDPYGRGVAVSPGYDRARASLPGDNAASALKSVVVDLSAYDWEGDSQLQRSFGQTVIYEMHVRGFTRHPSSGLAEEKRGTYLGIVEKIPYLQSLGITAVELLPVFQFDEQDAPDGLGNYWGYSPVSFFAPHAGYGTVRDPLVVIDEFRDMVKALHKAGIEVILDVVYNHTAEGGASGPTLSLRGLADNVYYILHDGQHANFSGTGNTLNANHSVVRRMIVDSLRFWVTEMHVDGFRFDLASILSRDESGRPLENPPVLFDIETDPCFAGVKIIAEAWDAAGLYQVGSFIGDRWKEWNGRFRDDVRAFVKGDESHIGDIASRFLASPDLYMHEQREPDQSINFVTCHDGFTLNDVVSYNEKHNEANLEDNRDGTDDNRSWNCGTEGPSDDTAIEMLRERQIKNLLAITLLSLGVPMLLMGDEVRRTQGGNNNAYCQDNDISWFDWSLLEKHPGLFRYVAKLIRFRFSMGLLADSDERPLEEFLRQTPLHWHGVRLGEPDWTPQSRSLAFEAQGERGSAFLILNAYWKPLSFELPAQARPWLRFLDTSRASPDDLCDLATAPSVPGTHFPAGPRSVVLLVCPRV